MAAPCAEGGKLDASRCHSTRRRPPRGVVETNPSQLIVHVAAPCKQRSGLGGQWRRVCIAYPAAELGARRGWPAQHTLLEQHTLPHKNTSACHSQHMAQPSACMPQVTWSPQVIWRKTCPPLHLQRRWLPHSCWKLCAAKLALSSPPPCKHAPKGVERSYSCDAQAPGAHASLSAAAALHAGGGCTQAGVPSIGHCCGTGH